MANLSYNPKSGQYEPLAKPSNAGSSDGRTSPPHPLDSGEIYLNKDYSGIRQPPKASDYVTPPKAVGQPYIDELEALKGQIPSIFKYGGNGGAAKYIKDLSVTDVGRSQDYQNFSKALNDRMLAATDPNANPFNQEALNSSIGAIDRQIQQQSDALREQATREGWMNTPRYERAQKELKFQGLIAGQQNKVQYKQAEANWNIQNKQVLTTYYNAYTSAEDENRKILLQTGKINADFAWKAAEKRASIAAASASQARQSRLQAFNATLGIIGKQIDLAKYDEESKNAHNWAMLNHAMNVWSFETGVDQAKAELEAKKAESKRNFWGTLIGTGLGFATKLIKPG